MMQEIPILQIEILQVPGWDDLEWLRHGFSTRSGGTSTAYGGKTLNLGWTKEDDPSAVRANRRSFVNAVDDRMRLVTIRQVHSSIVRAVRVEDGALEGVLETAEGKAVLEGDGLVTDVPGVLLAVGTADCVPVLVVDPVTRAVGAFHAGWRGTAAKIVERGVALMREEYGSRPESLLAAVGPGIGACCYRVGDEVRGAFDTQFPYADELFEQTANSPDGQRQYSVDLWKANHRQFVDAGIMPEQIAVIGECTACARDAEGKRRYFSHRAERGATGRMLNAIGIAST
ncbi:MAG TPA: peptidoglycan editing factor PgeF [Edaphobacter sp.]